MAAMMQKVRSALNTEQQYISKDQRLVTQNFQM